MALVSVAVGYAVSMGSGWPALVLLHTLLGTALVAAGAGAVNHWLERDTDALMRRTARRPLPTGRLSPAEVLLFGIGLGIAGVVYLAVAVPHPGAAITAAFTYLLYIGVYTPLKPITAWNTPIGAIPGALPPVIGWAAAGAEQPWVGLSLFLILFAWQLPHFYAIAWIYRAEYARAGLRMITVGDRDGRRTALAMVATCIGLLGVSVLPVIVAGAGLVYAVGALSLGLWFVMTTIRFARRPDETTARVVLRASLVYLPVVLGLWVLDGVLPPWPGRS
jgi:protoheme IX farnesyltransferase